MAMWLLGRMSKLLKTWPIDQIMLFPPAQELMHCCRSKPVAERLQRVEGRHRPEVEVRRRDHRAIKRSSALSHERSPSLGQ